MRKTVFYLCAITLFSILGYTIGVEQTKRDISPEACLSVCVEQYEKYGC